VKEHRWFRQVDWVALEQKCVVAPIIPTAESCVDGSNFDFFDESELPADIGRARN
jgi:hypothetical protein